MYELFEKFNFSSAHKIVDRNGNEGSLHGHNWSVSVFVEAKELDNAGILIDIKTFRNIVQEEIDRFDHVFLNELPDLHDVNPTAENIARILFDNLSKRLNDGNIRIKLVELWGSEKTAVRYYK